MTCNYKEANKVNFGGVRSPVRYIVIHYTGNLGDTAKNNADYFARETPKTSAHYFVDEREVWQTVPENATAWHCGTKGVYHHPEARNHNSIGVEICMEDKNGKLRTGSIDLAAELVRMLMARHNVPIDRVVRHYDITHKACPAPMVANTRLWSAFKEKLIAKEVDDVTIYHKLSEVPAWGKPTVDKLMKKGFLAGNANGDLDLEHYMLRTLVIHDRAGLYGK